MDCPRRMVGARLAIGLLALLLGMPLAMDRASAETPDEAVLRVHQRYYPGSLDPQMSSGLEFAAILSANYEGLTRLDENLDVVPGAADSWEFDDEGTVLTFHLRDDLRYSDGTPLTAARFADAIRRGCDPNIVGDYQHILFDIAGCQEFAALYLESGESTPVPVDDLAAYEEARAAVGVRELDEQTLELVLTHAAPYFPAIASMPIFSPVKQELIAEGGEGWWQDPALLVGNGPFRITRLEPDQLVVFAPNEHYWAGRPRLDRLEFVYVADSAAALEAYRVGDLDIVALDSALLPSVTEDAALSQELVTVEAAATSYLSLNLIQEPFADRKVREAFAYAFDRETYCNLLRGGGCIPALSWIPPEIPGHITTNAYAFDPERARQALAESSYGGPEQLPEITFVYWVEDPLSADWGEWIAGQYRDVLGVEIVLQPLEGQVMVEAMSDPATYPQMVITGWVQDYPDPQNWLSVYWTCAASFAQDAGYCNREFDAIVVQADRELDPAKRQALYEEASRLLVEDVPGVFLSHGVFHYLVKPEVTGIVTTPLDANWPGQTASLLTVDVG